MTDSQNDDALTETLDNIEQRRAPRVACQLEVQIEGVDPQPVMRLGNLSTLGLLVRTDRVPGKVGDLVYLRMRSSDLRDGADTMAKVVRVVEMEAGAAVAFHFLPESEGVKQELDGLFRWVLTDQVNSGDLRVTHSIPIEIATGPTDKVQEASVQELAVRRMLIETNWPLAEGERLQLVFTLGGSSRIPFEGIVRESQPLNGSFQAAVEVTGLAEQVDAAERCPGVLDSMDLILSDLARGEAARAPAEAHALSGSLARIPLVSLLTLLAAELLTGELRLDHQAERASILLKEGDIVNVSPEREVSELLGEWAARGEGSFSFLPGPVEPAPDWLPRSTRALIARLRFNPR